MLESFLLVHSSFNVFSVTIPLKQAQTVLLTSLNFSTTFAQCVRLLYTFYRDEMMKQYYERSKDYVWQGTQYGRGKSPVRNKSKKSIEETLDDTLSSL